MFIRIPETISIVYGIPIHRSTIMTVTRAHVGSVKNGSGELIQPSSWSRTFMGPASARTFFITSSETNCGTAIARTKSVR